MDNKKVTRIEATKVLTGLSRSTIYAMMKLHTFPQNFKLGVRSVGWLESDIQDWIDSRISASNVV